MSFIQVPSENLSHNDFQLKPSPKPGQHTREVLEQYMDKKEVDEMFTSGFASDTLRERKSISSKSLKCIFSIWLTYV